MSGARQEVGVDLSDGAGKGGDVGTLELDDAAARGLHGYARLVERALGLADGGHLVQVQPQPSIYLPLTARLSGYPDRDVALFWDLHHGWTLGVEHPTGDDTVVAYLSPDRLPDPSTVAALVEAVFANNRHHVPMPDANPAPDDSQDVLLRLAVYGTPRVITFTGMTLVDSPSAPR